MRVLLRVLMPVLGLALAGAGAMLATEVVAAWVLGADPTYRGVLVPWPLWRATLDGLTWRSVTALVVCGVAALLGALLLTLAATAGRRDIRLDDPNAEVTVAAAPRVLARLVGQRVRAGEQVASASVTASARKVKVVAICRGEVPTGMRTGVVERVGGLLDDLPLARRPRLSVSVRSDGGPR